MENTIIADIESIHKKNHDINSNKSFFEIKKKIIKDPLKNTFAFDTFKNNLELYKIKRKLKSKKVSKNTIDNYTYLSLDECFKLQDTN